MGKGEAVAKAQRLAFGPLQAKRKRGATQTATEGNEETAASRKGRGQGAGQGKESERASSSRAAVGSEV